MYLYAGEKYAITLFRWVLGFIFIYASLDKLRHPSDFAEAVYGYRILPEICINIFAIILPWIELIGGGLLVVGFCKKGSILIIDALLIIFFMAMAINLWRGLEIGCGCFGVESTDDKISVSYLLREMGMIAMGIYIYFSKAA